MTAKQYLKLHPEKYFMGTVEFGEPIYIADTPNFKTEVTTERENALIWTALDNPIKLDYYHRPR